MSHNNQTGDSRNEGKLSVVSEAALALLASGTLAFGPAVGVALAVIWGIHAGVYAMFWKDDSEGVC